MRLAVNVAENNPGTNNFKLGAVIAKRNRVKSMGINRHRTHKLQLKFAKEKKCTCLHAEIDAIRNYIAKYGRDSLSKCTLYVARVKKNGELGLAKPCEGCQRAIESYNIGKVVWTH